MEFDKEDIAISGAFVLAAAASVGIAEVTLFDWSLSGIAYTFGETGGTEVMWSTLVSIIALALVWVTNDPDMDSLSDEYTYAIVGTFALVLGIGFVPQIETLVTGSDFAALLALVIQSAGYSAISYLA